MLSDHPTFQDHTRERDLAKVPAVFDDYSELYCTSDKCFVEQLIKAIQDNQVQLIPRVGNAGTYQQLIKHLGMRAKEMENV